MVARSILIASLITAGGAFAQAEDKKCSACSPAEEVKHVDDKKHGHDHDDHAGHDHGGGLFDVVKKEGSFNTLAAALGQAGLEEMLSHDEWTIFAPTDEAFAKLDPAALDILLKPENTDKLKAVLLAHVVQGTITSAAIKTDATKVASVQGLQLSVVKDGEGTVTVNGVKVVKSDTPATNGIVHAIEMVIIPDGVLD